MINILIIGASSIIAKRVIKNLNSIYNIFTAGRNDNDICFDLESKITEIKIDKDFDIIINFAASFADNTVSGFYKNESINSLGAIKIVDLAIKTNCKYLMNISSIFTLNNNKNEYFGSYGLSKKHGEDNIEMLCKLNNIEFVSLSPSQIYDEYGYEKKHQPLLYNLIDTAKNSDIINLYGKHDVKRNYLFIDDLVNIIKLVIEKKVTGKYFCVHPTSIKLSQIADYAFAAHNKKGKVNFIKNKPNIPNIFIPRNFSLYKIINYTPMVGIKDGIKLIVNNVGETNV